VQHANILVVEDEEKIASITAAYLRKDGFEVSVASTGGEALRLVELEKPALVILDLMLPDMKGEEVCRRLRISSDVAIIMVTAKSSEAEKIAGLGLGADDYVTKPFSPRELVARVRSVLRRAGTGEPENEELVVGNGRLRIFPGKHEVRCDGRAVVLTALEFRLLLVLAHNPGRVFSRSDLISKVQGYDFEGYERTIDAHIKNLRRKLGGAERSKHHELIKTVFGVGYKLEAE